MTLAQLYLGVYESELEAAKAHDRAARFHFPDKSMTNFAAEAEVDLLISGQEVSFFCFTGYVFVAVWICVCLSVGSHVFSSKKPSVF